MKKKSLKITIQLELAYEIIVYSIILILIGLAYIFASNLLTFNFYTISFGLLSLCLIFLKQKSYLEIKDDIFHVYYLGFIHKDKIEMKPIDAIIFIKNKRKIELQSNNQTISSIYLSDKNKQLFMDWIIKQYPDIPCYIQKEAKING